MIDIIETTNEFSAKPSFLCDWCEYKPICQEWAHLYKLKNKPPNIYLNDTGVKLVNTYVEIQKRRKIMIDEIDNQLEQLKEAIITFAQNEKINTVFGTNNKVKISSIEKINYPGKNEKERYVLNNIIKKAGKWDDVSELDTTVLNYKIKENKWPQELINQIKFFQTIERSKRIFFSKINTKEE